MLADVAVSSLLSFIVNRVENYRERLTKFALRLDIGADVAKSEGGRCRPMSRVNSYAGGVSARSRFSKSTSLKKYQNFGHVDRCHVAIF
jgi:hypothetical protein